MRGYEDQSWEPKHYAAVVLLLVALGVLFVIIVTGMESL